MSMITPKTIVITAYPGKHGNMMGRTPEISLLDTSNINFDDGGGPKKRRRLTHLSPDEKLLRRKLKNRVAAQTARDRKKQLMSELEEKVAELEEKNKSLHVQNLTLKEAFGTLVKENEALKSRLSDPSASTIKTESGTLSTCCSSAEGASPESVSMDGTVLGLCPDDQPHDFISLLQKYTTIGGECVEQQETQTASSSPQSVCGGEGYTDSSVICQTGTVTSVGVSSPCGETGSLVGRSPAELESLNELIQIDHFYVKPQPMDALQSKPEAARAQLIQLDCTTDHKSEDTHYVMERKHALHSVPHTGVKRSHNGLAVQQPQLSNKQFASQQQFRNVSVEQNFILPETPTPSLSIPEVGEDLLDSLSEAETSLSLNFLESFDLDCSDLQSTAAVPSVQELKVEPSVLKIPETNTPELNTQQLFDEICQHYLRTKDTPAAVDSVDTLSDSGISDEALSPQSEGGSLMEDVSWHDSFIDLFPGLQ